MGEITEATLTKREAFALRLTEAMIARPGAFLRADGKDTLSLLDIANFAISLADEMLAKLREKAVPEKTPEMQFEVGESYKRRDGQKAKFLARRDDPQHRSLPLVFDHAGSGVLFHTEDGDWLDFNMEHPNDIIGPWKEREHD